MSLVNTYDSGGSGSLPGGLDPDYSSLGAWEVDTDGDLSSQGLTTLECYDSRVHGEHVSIGGCTNATATEYRLLRSAAGCATPFAMRDGTGANFRYTGNNARYVFRVNEDYIRFTNLCAAFRGTSTTNAYTFEFQSNSYVGPKVVNVVISDCSNSTAGKTASGGYVRGNPILFYNVIAKGCDGDGFYVPATTAGLVCCAAEGNNGYGFRGYPGAADIVWSCYAANNTSGDFQDASANWSASSGWNASKDTTADLGGAAGNNYKNSLDLITNGALDADRLPTTATNMSGASGAGANWGRNPFNDVSAVEDFGFVWNGTSEDALFPMDGRGNDRPTAHTADVAWHVGAAQYIAAATTYYETSGLDALISRTGIAATLGVDGLLARRFEAVVDLDVLLRATMGSTVALDSLLRAVKSGDISLDALVAAVGSQAVGLDSLLQAVKNGDISLDALLQTAGSASVSLGVLLQGVKSGTVSLDGLLQAAGTTSISLDAFLQAGGAEVASLDGLLQADKSGTISLDAILQASGKGLVAAVLDAMLQASGSTPINLDAFLATVQDESISLDAMLAVVRTEVVSLDALLRGVGSASVSLDGLLALVRTGEVSLDGLLQGIGSETVALDALLAAVQGEAISLDAILAILRSGGVSLDGMLAGQFAAGVDLDGLLAADMASGLRLDAIIWDVEQEVVGRFTITAPRRVTTMRAEWRATTITAPIRKTTIQ